jgi:hypothetical protein|nr:MAG TPA: hypothetical protein [Caudoviricetes sp.]
MKVFITASETNNRGEHEEMHYYLVHADSKEEAIRKTGEYITLFFPFPSRYCQALNVCGLDEKQIIHGDINAYYAREVIDHSDMCGSIVFARSAAEARRKLPPYNGDGVLALSVLPKITDIIL